MATIKANAWNRGNLRYLADYIDRHTEKPWSFGKLPSCYMAFADDLWGVEGGIFNVIDLSAPSAVAITTLFRLLNVQPKDEKGISIPPADITRAMGSAMLRRLADTNELYFERETPPKQSRWYEVLFARCGVRFWCGV